MDTNKEIQARILLVKAIKIAKAAHAGEVDLAGVDYIQHPLRVMLMGRTMEERIVGVLHDVIEHGKVTYESLIRIFGQRIADAVLAISRKPGETYMQYIHRLASDLLAATVKTYDLKDNMDGRRIPEPTSRDRQRTKKYAKALKILEMTVADSYASASLQEAA